MKGLLIKDLYMAKSYCKSYVLIIVVFLAVSAFGDDNVFFIFYPLLMAGIIPVTLLAYDEKSGWSQYCGVLPYSKSQIVSAKFIIGLVLQATVLLLSAIVQAVRMAANGGVVFSELAVLIATLFTIALFASSICLPFMFRYGVEKGRMAYYVMIGLATALATMAKLAGGDAFLAMNPNLLLPILCVVSVAIYALSWYLSIVFYNKRDSY